MSVGQKGCRVKRQPVITGLGIVSPIGIGVDNFWAAALAGRSGIGTPTLFDASKLPRECRIVELKDSTQNLGGRLPPTKRPAAFGSSS